MTAVRSILILGGGTAGWMTAASLAHRFQARPLRITLVESSQIGVVGVGEATVPAIRDYIASLGLDMAEVMRATDASVKLGIHFEGWAGAGRNFFHPFAQYGIRAGAPFHQIWLALRACNEGGELADYNLGTQLALAGRFQMPPKTRRGDFDVYDWALHFDASKFAALLRDYAKARGVTCLDARMSFAERDSETGDLRSLHLEDGRVLSADLFIDASGLRSLLLQKTLEVDYIDWKRHLPCDRAVALPCMANDGIAPYTRAIAQTAGWRWRIPLRSRIGNGYVYDSDHLSAEAAETELRAHLEGEALADANHIRFRTGHARRVWEGNCIGLGLAAGFLEPLESTSLVLIQTGIERLLNLFPDTGCTPVLRDEYNRVTSAEYERIRDFLILHYYANARREPFWRAQSQAEIPDSLRHRIELYRAKGYFQRREWDSFFDASWLSLYEGFGWRPEAEVIASSTAALDMTRLRDIAPRLQADIRHTALRAEPHAAFLKRLGQPAAKVV